MYRQAKYDPAELLETLRGKFKQSLIAKDRLDQLARVTESISRESSSQIILHFDLLVEDRIDLRSTFNRFFVAALESFTLPGPLRKKAEASARTYSKGLRPRIKKTSWAQMLDDELAFIIKYQESLEADLKLAEEVLRVGKPHATEGAGATKLRVGSFTLINTGGFDRKVMDAVASVAAEAEQLLRSADLGQVCYGDLQVTRSLSRREVLAYYHIPTDELYIRADLESDTLSNILHELGHRYEHRFLKDKRADLDRIFAEMEAKERIRKTMLRQKAKEELKPGKEFDLGGKHYTVLKNLYDEVILERSDKPGQRLRSKTDKILSMLADRADSMLTDPNYEGFVSEYAETKSGENFAEMFAHYVYGDLPVRQMGPFELLLFGTPKTANQRLASRVLTRWLG